MAKEDTDQQHILLICTVGGSPEPLAASLKRWRAARVLFLASKETTGQIEGAILPLVALAGLTIGPGCYETCVVADAQDFRACVQYFLRLSEEVRRWLDRGDAFHVVVDFTGGTKCMTAALALQAHRWKCRFSYVGGTERTKDGVGIVVSGKERIVHAENPWDSLGYQAVEDGVSLFDRGSYGAAAAVLDAAGVRASDAVVKRELATMKLLSDAYAAWDRFDHRKAADLLAKVEKSANDILAMFDRETCTRLTEQIKAHIVHLRALTEAKGPSRGLILDLLANAKRREKEGRYDDAVARLYRAIEALAQARLREGHGIDDTGKVSLESVPEPMRGELEGRAIAGEVRLGLQDAYALLRELDDPVGWVFSRLRWDDQEHSPLTTRNQSILAHGFQPVSERVVSTLWSGCLKLAGLEGESALPTFPRFSNQHYPDIRLGSGKLPKNFATLPRPADPEGLVLQALLEERSKGR